MASYPVLFPRLLAHIAMSTVNTWGMRAGCRFLQTLAADESSPQSYSLHLPDLPIEDMVSPVGDLENQVNSPMESRTLVLKSQRKIS
jgi:hypothetical protein